MTDLSVSEQRARQGFDAKGRQLRKGPPRQPDTVRVDGVSYPTIGEEERVDMSEAELDERRESFAEDRRARHQHRKQTRRLTPLWLRLEHVTNAMGRLQAPKAMPYNTEGGGRNAVASDHVLPPGGRELAVAHAEEEEVERRLRTIEKAIERLEDLLDAHRGLAAARDFALMDSYEKNAVILTEFEGWTPEEVYAFEPALGKPRTIRWVREEWAEEPKNGGWSKRRGVCGHRPEQCECAGVRRAPRKAAA
jgi:hypothetical protein